MQTIKTAAVVVLMLTVLYGGYVSLTTPPEPLPEEIEEFLVIEESGGMPFASGNTLAGGLELDAPPAGVLGEPQAMDQGSAAGVPPLPLTGTPTAAVSTVDPAAAPTGLGGPSKPAASSFADLAPRSSGDSLQGGVSSQPTKLPAVDSAAPTVSPAPMESYGSTDRSFELPDPSQGSASFDPSKGVPFETPDAESSDKTAVATLESSGGASPDNRGLINALASADAMYAKGQLKDALATLSVFYSMPNINAAQRGQLLNRLDPLAREVIYSRRHLLEQPRRVGTNETLQEIAKDYGIPWQLLANINHIDDPVTVLPGTELKVLRGPFRAEVDLTAKQMTLFLGDLYAGRFDIEVGNDPTPKAGTFTVQEKRTERVFYDRTGIAVPAGSTDNPYGNMWLDLGGQICIHGSPNTVLPTDKGCISVAGDYADDVYGILSQGSSVAIRR